MTKKDQDVFELLDRLKEKVKQEKQTKSYRLFLFNSLWQNGYNREMGPVAAWVYVILGDKCTGEETLAGKLCLLVYGGWYSKTIIKELAEFEGKSIWIIWRALKRLKKIGRVDYQTRQRVGTRILIYPIPGAFERHFNKSKNGLIKSKKKGVNNSTGAIDNSTGAITNSTGAIIQPGLFEESGKENKQNPELPEIENPLTKTTTQRHVVACSEICQILKGKITPEKVQNLIKDRNQEQMIKLAHRSIQRATQNPVGLFITMVKANARIPGTGNKEVIVPKHEGRGVFAFCPDEVIQTMREKFQEKELQPALWKLLDKYHLKFEPLEFHKFKEDLSGQERSRLLDLAKKEAVK